MKALLKLKKCTLAILVFTSLCFVSNYSNAQGLLGKIKKTQEDIKKATEEAKKIKNDTKKQVDDVKNMTGRGGTNGNSGSTGTNTGNTTTGSDVGAPTVTNISNEKFYRITNVSTGQELAITLVYSTDKALHTAIYEATLELRPVVEASDAQIWHLNHGDRASTPDEVQFFTKVGFNPNSGGYTMWLGRPDSSNNPDDKINFLKMYHNQSQLESYWQVKKLSNGYYRIFSDIAKPQYLNKRFEERKDRWNEERCFQAVTVGGKTKIKQMKNADIDAQYWKLTELDYIPTGR